MGATISIVGTIVVLNVVLDFTTKRDMIKKYHAYFSRVAFVGIYIGIAIFLASLFKLRIFYVTSINDFNDWPRFVWCIIGSCAGFSLIASQSRFNDTLPYGAYILYYPPMLVVFSSFVYTFVTIFPATKGHVFYYLSFSISFVLAFLIDNFWNIISEIIKKIKFNY